MPWRNINGALLFLCAVMGLEILSNYSAKAYELTWGSTWYQLFQDCSRLQAATIRSNLEVPLLVHCVLSPSHVYWPLSGSKRED